MNEENPRVVATARALIAFEAREGAGDTPAEQWAWRCAQARAAIEAADMAVRQAGAAPVLSIRGPGAEAGAAQFDGADLVALLGQLASVAIALAAVTRDLAEGRSRDAIEAAAHAGGRVDTITAMLQQQLEAGSGVNG